MKFPRFEVGFISRHYKSFALNCFGLIIGWIMNEVDGAVTYWDL